MNESPEKTMLPKPANGNLGDLSLMSDDEESDGDVTISISFETDEYYTLEDFLMHG